jgi:signal transduction histidine kinase
METFESPVYAFQPQSSPLQRNSFLKWSAITGAWFLLGVIYVIPIYLEVRAEGMVHSFGRVFAWGTLTWVAWAPLTPLMILLARRFPLVGGSWKRSLGVHVPSFILFSALHSAVVIVIVLTVQPWDNMGSSPTAFWPRFLARFKGSLGSDLLIYGGVVGICYAIDYYRKYREREFVAAQLETQLAQAQLDSLRMQLHPHFLFNTLNGIVGLVRDNNNEAAVKMLVGLSDLLRHALEHSDRQEVELKEELSFIKLYLSIQQMRFSDRLQVEFEIDPGTTQALVPNLLIQPLVENALRHGIGRSADSGSIKICVRRNTDRLSIIVADNGGGLPNNWQLKTSSGIGLANTIARLQQLYGENYGFDIRNRDQGGVEVEVVMPLRIFQI